MTSFEVHKSHALQGELIPPGDKSITQRAIIFAGLAEGTSVIHHYLNSGDCLSTLNAMRALGVTVELEATSLTVHGVGLHGLTPAKQAIDCGNSGTGCRLLTGVLAAQSFETTLTGDSSLSARPMQRVVTPLTQMGARVVSTDGHLPVTLSPVPSLSAIEYTLPVPSAQVKSAILLAALYAQGETIIHTPKGLRDHTERMLALFGAPLKQADDTCVVMTPPKQLTACEFDVPGDISSAAFFIVAATLIPGSNILIKNVGMNPTRTGLLNILEAMGANITVMNQSNLAHEPVADLHVKSAQLQGIAIPEKWVPFAIDEMPILMIAAACAKGTTKITGAQELRVKESDRIAAMVAGLNTLGIHAEALEDGAVIHEGQFQGGLVETYHDHRIAMSFAIAGALANAPVNINGVDAVATSFPNFVDCAQQLGIQIEVKHP